VSQYNKKTNFLIDLIWVLTQLKEDNIISEEDHSKMSSTTRSREDSLQHPFIFISRFNLKHLTTPKVEINLEFLTQWLANKANAPVFHIDPLKIDVPTVTAVMSYKFSEKHQVLTVKVTPDEIVLATAQPFYSEWESGLSQIIRGKKISLVISNPLDIQKYCIEFFNLAKSVRNATGESNQQQQSNIANFEQLLEINSIKNADANDKHIVNIVDWLLQYAFDQRASDLHLEPRRDIGKIRFRIDGMMHDVYELPSIVMTAVTSRIKILGRMDVAEKRRPQDGRLKTKKPDGDEVELRLSTLPTAFGEKLVMRVFDPDVLLRSYEQLGLTNDDYARWQKMVTSPTGIVLVTGPTGSGKTTTLYSTLKQLATASVNVCTLEDPIEMIEPSFNQVQIQTNIDLGFIEGIRALLRQDPDIIMVGEIRDLETAEMAIQAALTGHLVISTLHTNDAPSAIMRLRELGVAPYLISATLLGIMAQRLVRTLCPHCKVVSDIDPEGWWTLTAPWKGNLPKKVFKPGGCLECRNTGYLGRMGVYEIMLMSQKVKDMVTRESPLDDLRSQAIKEGMFTLRLSGANKISKGLTTVEEILRVTPTVSAFE